MSTTCSVAGCSQTGRLALSSIEPEGVAEIIGGYPGFVPGVVVTLIVAFAIAGPLSRSLGIRRILGIALATSIGVVLAATLTAGPEAQASVGPPFCDVSPPEFSPLRTLALNEANLNVLLFIPLGSALGLLPRSRSKVVLVGAALLAPFAIETIQGAIPVLDRACQSRDVVDNLSGLLLGLVTGSAIGRLIPTLSSGNGGDVE